LGAADFYWYRVTVGSYEVSCRCTIT
jgi:hypothetical protein